MEEFERSMERSNRQYERRMDELSKLSDDDAYDDETLASNESTSIISPFENVILIEESLPITDSYKQNDDNNEFPSVDNDTSFDKFSNCPDSSTLSLNFYEQDDGVDDEETSASNDPKSKIISFENDILIDKSPPIADSHEQNDEDDDKNDEKPMHLFSVLSLSPAIPNDSFGTCNTTSLAVIDTFSLDKIADHFPDKWNGHVPFRNFSHDFINNNTTVFPLAALRPRSPPSDTDSLIADDAPT